MKCTEFYCNRCKDYFSIKRAVQVDLKEVPFCPNCFMKDSVSKQGTKVIKGRIYTLKELNEMDKNNE